MKNNYGANIERGIIAEVCEDGYKVQSLTRRHYDACDPVRKRRGL